MDEQKEKSVTSHAKKKVLRSKRVLVIMGSTCFLLAILLGTISFIPAHTNITLIINKAGQLSGFLITGIAFTLLLKKYGSTDNEHNVHRTWLYVLLVSLFIYGGLFMLYFLINKAFIIMASGSSCAFILPYIISQAWYFFGNVPTEETAARLIIEEESVVPQTGFFQQKISEEKKDKQYENELKPQLSEERKRNEQADAENIRQELDEMKRMKEEAHENKLRIRQREEEERKRLIEQEKIRLAEKQIIQLAEQERIRREEEERIRRAEEEKVRLAEEERIQLIEQEKIRLAEEQVIQLAEQERIRRDEEERIRRAEQEKVRLAEEERIRLIEQERIRLAEEQRIQLAEQERIRRKEEERMRRAEQEKVRFAEEERIRLIEQERIRLAEEQRIQLAEQERIRRKEEERTRLAEEERIRLAEEEKVRLIEQEKIRLSEEEIRRAEEEKIRLAEEERIRLIEQEKVRLAEEERIWLIEQERIKLAEKEKIRQEEEEKIKLAEKGNQRLEEENRQQIYYKPENAESLPVDQEIINHTKAQEPQNDKVEKVQQKNISKPGDNRNKDKIWFYNEPDTKRQPVILLNSVPLYIQLSVKNIDTTEQLFTVSAPLDMNTGDFFNYFITLKTKNRKVDIDVINNEQEPIGWKFYARGFMGAKRQLEPALSLRKNKIKEMSVITARRV